MRKAPVLKKKSLAFARGIEPKPIPQFPYVKEVVALILIREGSRGRPWFYHSLVGSSASRGQ